MKKNIVASKAFVILSFSRVVIALEKQTPWLLVFAGIIALSPLFLAYAPIKGNIISILALLLILLSKFIRKGLERKYFIWCLVILFSAIIPTLYWQEARLILIPKYFLFSILAIPLLNNNDYKVFITLSSWLIFIILLGAVLGVFYAYYGGPPIFSFANEDGRLNQLYLTTLTNTQIQNLIRPAGIFDEPGALSFITCFIAALRHATGRSKKLTWVILTLGFITSSFAHLAYFLLHLAEEFKSKEGRQEVFISTIFYGAILLGIVFILPPLHDVLSTFLFSRLTTVAPDFFTTAAPDFFTTAAPESLGQDRITMMHNAINYLNLRSFMFGLDSDCAVGLANCTADKGYAYYGDNWLTLIVHWGVFLAFPYYLSLAYLAFNSFRLRSFIMLGMLFLLLQRPYTMSYGYSLLIVMTIFVLVKQANIKYMKPKKSASQPVALSITDRNA